MINLSEISGAYLAKYPVEKIAEVIGKEARLVERWKKIDTFPALVDLIRLQEFDPSVLGADDSDPIGQTKEEVIAEYLEQHPTEQIGAFGVERDTIIAEYLASPAFADQVAALTPTESEPTPYEWPQGDKVAILMPSNRDPDWGILKAFAAIFERDKMQLLHPGEPMSAILYRDRNQLAADFLASGCPWAVNWDDDTVPPHGDVEYLRHLSGNPAYPESYARLNPIGRLLQAKKTLVGATYFSRRRGGRAQYAGAFASTLANDVVHNGPRNLVEKQSWVGMGFTLIHRSVFTDIIRTQPQIEIKDPAIIKQVGYKYRFFNSLSIDGPDSENSEDVAFCTRALRAGHQPHVDHAVSCVHVGRHGFSYHNTQRPSIPLQ